MNCLSFSIKYKINHRDSRIKIESNIFIMLSKHGLDKRIIKYFFYVGPLNTLKIIFIPHFYIVHDGHRYDNSKNDFRDKSVIKLPTHLIVDSDLDNTDFFFE